MTQIKYDYSHVPTLRNFALSDKFIRGVMGPFGSGKSSAMVVEVVRRGMAQRPGTDGIRKTKFAVIRNTYRQLRDTTLETFFKWLPPKPEIGTWKASDYVYVIDGFKNTRIEVLFRALDRPDQVQNLLSLELTAAWINEARETPKAIFEALQGRVGRYPPADDGGCTWSGIFMDTNPPDTDHWWYKLFEEVCPPNAELFKQPSGLSDKAENRRNLGKNYYTNLAIGKSEDFIRVYCHGDYGYVQEGKPVYPEYNDSVHCREVNPIKGLTIYRGWDYGLTPSCVFTQLTPKGQWIVFDELVSDQMGIDRFSDIAIEFSNQHYNGFVFEDIGDPAGSQRAQTDEKTCEQILGSKGIYVSSGEQDLTIRLESVKKPLTTMIEGQPGLLVSPRCKYLRKGFQGKYQFRRLQVSEDRFSDKPDKNDYSHPHDALQYVGTRLFGGTLRMTKEIPKKERHKRSYWGSWKTA